MMLEFLAASAVICAVLAAMCRVADWVAARDERAWAESQRRARQYWD